MNQKELIDAVADQCSLPKTKIAAVIGALFGEDGVVTQEMQCEDGKLVLTGFGTFKVKQSPARNGRNPATGEAIRIPARARVTFKPGAFLKG